MAIGAGVSSGAGAGAGFVGFDIDDEIAGLYRKLRAPGMRSQEKRRLEARIDGLETAEAARMRVYTPTASEESRGLRDALRRADGLLAKHERM